MGSSPLLDGVVMTLKGPCGIAAGDRVLVGCSGGMDSTVLLDLLSRVPQHLKITLSAVTVDHGLRENFDGEADAAEETCRARSIPWRRVKGQVTGETSSRLGPEAAARAVRLRALEREARRVGATAVALAHHLDDQAETVLMRALVGTGVRGLAAMRPRNGIWIRPLLEHSREELVLYARSRTLAWAEDPTNQDSAFLRNRIRHGVMPAVLDAAGRAAPSHLAQLADRAAEDEALLTVLAGEVEQQARDGGGLRVDRLAGKPWPLVLRILRDLAEGPDGGSAPGAVHLAAMGQLLAGPDRSAGVDLPGAARIERRGGRIFVRRPPTLPDAVTGEVQVPWEGRCAWPAVELVVESSLHGDRARVGQDAGAGSQRAWFDRDRLTSPPRMHKFAAGDRMRPFGGSGSRKVSRVLAEAGIPRELRRSWPVVSVDGTVIWVPGARAADVARVDASTTRILDLSVGEGS